MYLRISRLLAPPLLEIFLQLNLCLLQEVLDVFNLSLQLPQLGVECLETVIGTERIIAPSSTTNVHVHVAAAYKLCTYLAFSISTSFFSSSSFGSGPAGAVPSVKPVPVHG